MDIKEESCFQDFCSENEEDNKDLVKKVMTETVISSSDIKPELQDSSCCSQNEEHDTMRFNENINESEMENKIEIKEEHWWIEREDSLINNIKVETHEDFSSREPPSLYKEAVSTYTSNLFSTEELENDVSFSVNVNAPEYKSDRKCQGQESVVKYSTHLEKYRFVHESKNVNTCDTLNKGLNEFLSPKTRQLIDGGKRYKCNICKKSYTQLSGLRRHNRIHEGLKPHKCNICNKSFTESSSLKRHKFIHEGTKPHKCNICSQAFIQLAGLKEHRFTHEGIKPHMCNICHKAFTGLSSFKVHKLIHEGIKPYKCNICNRAFTQSSNLKTHKLIHGGIKPHKCDICNMAFNHLSGMKRHKFIHEEMKPNKCNMCNKAFIRLSDLKKHKLIHEGINPHKCNNL